MWRIVSSTHRALARCTIRHARCNTQAQAPSQLLNQCNFTTSPMPTSSSWRTFSSQGSSPASYQCVHVFVSVKPGTEDQFLAASLTNARESSLEQGIARFDVIQQEDDPTKFVLVEVYKNSEAPAAHKNTNHYLTWRKTVEHMMAEPRKAIKYKNLYPTTSGGWDYPDVSLE